MLIEILGDKNINKDYDSISILNQIPTDDNKRCDVANIVFEELMKLRVSIERTNWIDLSQLCRRKTN